MAEQRYRFGGPIPEAAFRLRVRRERRDEVASWLRERAQEERAAQYERDAKAGVVRVHPLSSDDPISLDLQKEQARAVLAPFKRHDAPAATDLLPLCVWRIDGQDFSRPGFTTDIEQAKFWIRRNATVTPLHLPSEDGKFRTVSGAVLEKLTRLASVDSWGCPLPESASTAAAELQAPATHCGSHPRSTCPSECCAGNSSPALSVHELSEEIAARARDFRRG
ncbi:hypothetical protein [Delftia tsuruhatensis]|uniref:hypothetical protein n=1 Tax=Delftia tsuruhatensis TaxID=180282 RepID=UPI002AD4C5F2|nr:hypothetical protein [Delftia tsuruhatensis]WQM81722.1 hypothetical protein RNT40_23885 [Delftia tsuruhatensis]